MVDTVNPATRRQMMASIKGKDTKPELLIRRELHARGFRYRLHDRSLPGRPDMTFRKHNAVLFVNGCFWHRHGCHMFEWPATRKEFWQKKLDATAARDSRNQCLLQGLGWRTGVIWECATRGAGRLEASQIGEVCEAWLTGGHDQLEVTGA